MTFAEVIRNAIPDASVDMCEYILWNRTPYPMGKVTARDLYKAANRVLRAGRNSISLCDMCDNKCAPGSYCCDHCEASIARAAA